MNTLIEARGVETIDRCEFNTMMSIADIPIGKMPIQNSLLEPNFVGFGDGIASTVIHLSRSHGDAEVEIRRMGERWMGTNTGRRITQTPRIPITYCQFGSLKEGVYELRIKGDRSPKQRFLAKNEAITELRWAF
jgi:hypothetical protein